MGKGVLGRGGWGGASLLLQLPFAAGLYGCRCCRPEAAVASVGAGIHIPDPAHAAAGNHWVADAGHCPEPPADVLAVGTVAQGGVPTLVAWRGQRVVVEKGGLQQGAPQHQWLKQGRRGDAGAVAPAAAQLLLWQGGLSAVAALAPGWWLRPNGQVRLSGWIRPGGWVRLGKLAVAVGMRLQQTEDGRQVSCIHLLHINKVIQLSLQKYVSTLNSNAQNYFRNR